MLQSKDLRIGNYIMQGGKITCVEKLSRSIDDWDRTNGKRTQDCQPIPLTEEWLLKFGFETQGIMAKVWILKNINVWALDGGFANDLDYPINYVHQLQNLYFALTGEELTTKNQ